MDLSVITPPAVEPVTAGEAFFQLKLTTDPEADVAAEPQYAEVMRCIQGAREQCEQFTRRAFIRQTVLLTIGPRVGSERRGLRWYMNGGGASWGRIELRRPPLISVDAVRYYDDANELQTVDPELYFVGGGLVPKLCFTDAFSGPSAYLREDAIQVEYTVGYPAIEADAEADPPMVEDLRGNVPASIKQAILLGVQLQFDRLQPNEREAIERAQASLLSSYRVHSF